MIDLNLTRYHAFLRVKNEAQKRFIFDPIRKKWLVMQPEECVRQLIIEYLWREKGYSKNLFSIEKGVKVNKLQKRYDLLVYDRSLKPLLLVECKSPDVRIKQDALDQVAWYNMTLQVRYLLVTNGIESFCYALDYEAKTYDTLSEVPAFVS